MAETILFVEDSADDRFLFERAVGRLPFKSGLQFAESGAEAVSYLKGEGKFSNREKFPLPTIIFTDIDMPRMDGFELLEWLKNKSPDNLHRIPVVMFSSSGEQSDIDRAYDLGASAYLVKPGAFDQLEGMFKATGEFFIEHAEKPSVAKNAPKQSQS